MRTGHSFTQFAVLTHTSFLRQGKVEQSPGRNQICQHRTTATENTARLVCTHLQASQLSLASLLTLCPGRDVGKDLDVPLAGVSFTLCRCFQVEKAAGPLAWEVRGKRGSSCLGLALCSEWRGAGRQDKRTPVLVDCALALARPPSLPQALCGSQGKPGQLWCR